MSVTLTVSDIDISLTGADLRACEENRLNPPVFIEQ
jgi:hypothetical protein